MARTPVYRLYALLAVAPILLAQRRAPIPESAKLINSLEGVDLFQSYCASCHGKDAKGKGPVAASLKSAPVDLTKISARNGGKFPFEKVQAIIAGQAPVVVSHGNREMPVWGPVFSQVANDQDFGTLRIYNLAKYLETLQK
jgi:mono/diheme cytochrome c family protein